ncbi:MAG: DMT family transporter, partial [Oscillospiraceae bacterium]
AWSGSDLFSKLGSRPDDRNSHLKLVMSVGLVMGIHAAWQIFIDKVDYDPKSWLIYLPVSLLYILSMTFGYIGLRYLELSVSSPVCNSSGALTALLCFAFLGQRMSAGQFAAVALICAGVLTLGILEKRRSDAERRKAGETSEKKYTVGLVALSFPIIYCVLDALGTFADAYYLEYRLDETSANISYELTFAIAALLCLVYVVFVKREKLTLARDGYKLAGAVFETAGQFAYVFALSGNAIVAAPAIASYSVFSVLWSRLFLKEKLPKSYYIAIALVLAGIIVLGVFEEA